ncbi:Acetoin dehydrogenase operon transcriptional activator AcoR [Streptomyces sp. Go-475]|nr:Acetoin dehydrogenase operon transcriptional activator AcoR [Streptomyces sp. Go-475]
MVRSGEEPQPAGRATEGTGPARLRERFLQGEPVEEGVRGSILDSWRRCRSLGLSPDQSDLPYRDDFDPGGRIVRAAVPVLDRLQATFAGSQVNISVADANGTVLLRRFGDPSMARRLPAIQVAPGFVFSEQVAGTNGIGLALAERQLIRVYGAEHFAERSQQNACVALPVRDPLSGRIEGVLCFGYPRGFEQPGLGVTIRRAAEVIERRLLGQSSAHERALLRAYAASGAGAAGLRRGVARDAPVDALPPRDREILLEKAAELISRAQRAAVDVALPDGRLVTLVSRPMTSASGVRGFAVEAVLPGSPAGAPLVLPHQLDTVPDLAALATTPLPARPSLTLPPGHLATEPGPVVTAVGERGPAEPGDGSGADRGRGAAGSGESATVGPGGGIPEPDRTVAPDGDGTADPGEAVIPDGPGGRIPEPDRTVAPDGDGTADPGEAVIPDGPGGRIPEPDRTVAPTGTERPTRVRPSSRTDRAGASPSRTGPSPPTGTEPPSRTRPSPPTAAGAPPGRSGPSAPGPTRAPPNPVTPSPPSEAWVWGRSAPGRRSRPGGC